VKCAGATGRENAGMSNRKSGESPDRRKPKVSSAMTIIGGLGVPKRNRAYGHGIAMVSRLIFLPRVYIRRDDGEHKAKHVIGFVSSVPRMPARKIRQGPQGTFANGRNRRKAGFG
jgi:hypothetical protein